jgi:hypothetical protein
MSFAMFPKHNDSLTSGAPSSEQKVFFCIAAICLLASTPLLISIALMIWGG